MYVCNSQTPFSVLFFSFKCLCTVNYASFLQIAYIDSSPYTWRGGKSPFRLFFSVVYLLPLKWGFPASWDVFRSPPEILTQSNRNSMKCSFWNFCWSCFHSWIQIPLGCHLPTLCRMPRHGALFRSIVHMWCLGFFHCRRVWCVCVIWSRAV